MNFYIFLVIACYLNFNNSSYKTANNRESSLSHNSIKYNSVIKSHSKFDNEFLSYFTAIDKPEIEIEYFDNLNSINQPGRLIDSRYTPFIIEKGLGWRDVNYDFGYNFYAYYIFPLSKDKIGLIIRCPGMYVESEINLFSFNKADSSLKLLYKLADNWGDAGYVYKLKSWLKKINNNGNYEIISCEKVFQPFYLINDSLGNLDGLLVDSINYSIGNSDSIIKSYTEATIDSVNINNFSFSIKKNKTKTRDTIFYSKKPDELINFELFRCNF